VGAQGRVRRQVEAILRESYGSKLAAEVIEELGSK
jgi:hypothetical protein